MLGQAGSGLIPNAHVISAAGLPGVDFAHFTTASYRTLGERYAQKMLNLVYNICDSTTIESWVELNGGVESEYLIDVSPLGAGMYYLKLFTDKGIVVKQFQKLK